METFPVKSENIVVAGKLLAASLVPCPIACLWRDGHLRDRKHGARDSPLLTYYFMYLLCP